VKAETALEIAGRSVLLRVRGDQRRVQVDRDLLGLYPQLPRMLTRLRTRRAQPLDQPGLRGDPLDHSKRGRVRADRPEQRLLIAQRCEVRDALATIGEHHRQIANHPPRIVPRAAFLHPRQPQRQRPRQPHLVGQLRQQRRPRMRDQSLSVRPDLYREIAAIALHPQGEPPELENKVFDNPNPPSSAGHPRAPDHPGRGR
jgi:hypothetical protein